MNTHTHIYIYAYIDTYVCTHAHTHIYIYRLAYFSIPQNSTWYCSASLFHGLFACGVETLDEHRWVVPVAVESSAIQVLGSVIPSENLDSSGEMSTKVSAQGVSLTQH